MILNKLDNLVETKRERERERENKIRSHSYFHNQKTKNKISFLILTNSIQYAILKIENIL